MESKQETIGVRPTEYSEFHRTLGGECYATDIDFVEWRIGRGIVGFFAVTGRLKDERHLKNSKPMIWARTEVERQILYQLSISTGKPAFLVIHTSNMNIFHVHNIKNSIDKFDRMDQEEYTQFIRKL